MGLLVKMCNADVERFETAVRFGIVPETHELYLYGDDTGAEPIAAFHPTAWWAVFHAPPPRLPPATSDRAVSVTPPGQTFTFNAGKRTA